MLCVRKSDMEASKATTSLPKNIEKQQLSKHIDGEIESIRNLEVNIVHVHFTLFWFGFVFLDIF